MHPLRLAITSFLIISSATLFPGSSIQAEADVASHRTIHTLAAATSSTVFAETSYGAYGGYNFENGTYWYRDGYPYPEQMGWNQGGWGFSGSEVHGSYHPYNCQGNLDSQGLCFETGDSNGRFYRLCGWWSTSGLTCLNWYASGWENGSRGFIKNGGYLGSEQNPDAYRVFFTSDSPSYYPNGIKHNVPIIDIYRGGWTLCWNGYYSDVRTEVESIKRSCNGKYTIMAGSKEDPILQEPVFSSPKLFSAGDEVGATWNVINTDQLEVASYEGHIQDFETGKSFSCDFDFSQQGNDPSNGQLACVFKGSSLQRRYSLDLDARMEIFGDKTIAGLENHLVITNQFQVVPTRFVGKPATESEFCAYNAPVNKIINIRVGGQNKNVLTNEFGKACVTYLMPEKPIRQAVRANYGKIKSIDSLMYLPSFKFYYRGGTQPKLGLDNRGLPRYAKVTLTRIARSNGVSVSVDLVVSNPQASAKLITAVPVQPETYDLYVYVNGVLQSTAVLEVTPKVASGGFRN